MSRGDTHQALTGQAVDAPLPEGVIKRPGMFVRIPKIIKKKGRAKGFERVRDLVLNNWEMLSALSNPLAAIKLVLEVDKHAMFSEMAAEKAKGAFDMQLWLKFQDYLDGKLDVPPGAENSRIEMPGSDGGLALEEDSNGNQEHEA